MTPQKLSTKCCVVGGGPAGMMLGYLLARQGVPVIVIEKHKDFFRDFRGDTVHPSTLQLFYELGLLDEFLRLPHQELQSVGGSFGGFPFKAASFRHVPAHCKFVALMPQWDFLDFLSKEAKKFPDFDLRLEHAATGLLREGDRVTGVEVQTPGGAVQIEAELVAGCDGRHSTVRQAAQLELLESGVPIDVLWFRVSRSADDPEEVFGIVNYGRALILINRGDYFQAGLIVRKGSLDQLKAEGLDAFRQTIAKMAPYLSDRVQELQDWDQIKLLTVQINRLRKWYRSGVLCIGDSAHAMSPAGGVGINLAIQDAVATANLLGPALRQGHADEAHLALVQKRREFPARFTQWFQINAHNGLARIFEKRGPVQPPWQFQLAVQIPGFQRVLGYMVGIGVRPEHIRDTSRRPADHRPSIRTMAACAAVAAFAFAGVLLLGRRR